jgi:hypothetical protein
MLTVQEYTSNNFYGIQRISRVLASFQSGYDDDPVALQIVIDSGADFSVPGTTPEHNALHRLYKAIQACYQEADGYLARQAIIPIDPSCYTEKIDCEVAKLVMHKISNCPGMRTNADISNRDDAVAWLKLVANKTVKLILNPGCPGQTVTDTIPAGAFGYSSPEQPCARFTNECAKDQCGNETARFRTWVKETRANNKACCDGSTTSDEDVNSIAGEEIPAFKAVSLINNKLYVTDPTNILSAHSVVGVSTVNTAIDQPVVFKHEGQVSNPAWNFVTTTTGMLFVALNGDITDIPPTSGWSIDFGSVGSTNSAVIDIDEVQLLS